MISMFVLALVSHMPLSAQLEISSLRPKEQVFSPAEIACDRQGKLFDRSHSDPLMNSTRAGRNVTNFEREIFEHKLAASKQTANPPGPTAGAFSELAD